MAVDEISQVMQKYNDYCLVLVIGNTGCGKSTLLTSLIFGKDSLEIEKIDGKRVIKQKKEFELKDLFSIGHDDVSKTFLPDFYPDRKNKVLYADIAGLQDTRGNLMEFVNKFVTKYLFMKSKRIKFIVAIT